MDELCIIIERAERVWGGVRLNLLYSLWSSISTLYTNLFQQPDWRNFLDIFLMAVVIYEIIRLLLRTRASAVFKGIGVLLIFFWLSDILQLNVVNWMLQQFINTGVIVMVILFQPELRKALEQVAERYDYIFIDCPPSLELLTLNALCAADSLLVPLQGEYYALEGLSDLMGTVRIVRRGLNPKLEIEGVLLTMFDGRTNLAIQVAQEIKRFFPGKVYSTVIPRNIRLSEAPSHGKPINAYDRACRGAEAYGAVAEEFLRKNGAEKEE